MPNLLPPSLAQDPLSRAFEAGAARLQAIDLTPLLLAHTATCGAAALPYLCAQWGAGGALWELMTDETMRRRLAGEALHLARIRGTRAAVTLVCDLAGHSGARVRTRRETLVHDGTAHHNGLYDYGTRFASLYYYRVTVPWQAPMDAVTWGHLWRACEDAAPLRCRLRRISLEITAASPVDVSQVDRVQLGAASAHAATVTGGKRARVPLTTGAAVTTAQLLDASGVVLGSVTIPSIAPAPGLEVLLTLTGAAG